MAGFHHMCCPDCGTTVYCLAHLETHFNVSCPYRTPSLPGPWAGRTDVALPSGFHRLPAAVREQVSGVISQFNEKPLSIVVIGCVNSGKSTFLNCLLAHLAGYALGDCYPILPTNIAAETRVCWQLEYGSEITLDGVAYPGLCELHDAVLPLARVSGGPEDCKVHTITLPFLKREWRLVDTPGIGEDGELDGSVIEYLRNHLCAVVWTTNIYGSGSPKLKSNHDFFLSLGLPPASTIFVLTAFDTLLNKSMVEKFCGLHPQPELAHQTVHDAVQLLQQHFESQRVRAVAVTRKGLTQEPLDVEDAKRLIGIFWEVLHTVLLQNVRLAMWVAANAQIQQLLSNALTELYQPDLVEPVNLLITRAREGIEAELEAFPRTRLPMVVRAVVDTCFQKLPFYHYREKFIRELRVVSCAALPEQLVLEVKAIFKKHSDALAQSVSLSGTDICEQDLGVLLSSHGELSKLVGLSTAAATGTLHVCARVLFKGLEDAREEVFSKRTTMEAAEGARKAIFARLSELTEKFRMPGGETPELASEIAQEFANAHKAVFIDGARSGELAQAIEQFNGNVSSYVKTDLVAKAAGVALLCYVAWEGFQFAWSYHAAMEEVIDLVISRVRWEQVKERVLATFDAQADNLRAEYMRANHQPSMSEEQRQTLELIEAVKKDFHGRVPVRQ